MSDITLPPVLDQSAEVHRLYEIVGDSFRMYSKISSDFGDLILLTSMDLLIRYDEENDPRLDIHQVPQVGRVEDFPFDFRIGEMYYFLRLVPLFNPKKRTDYGLPQTQTDLP